MKIISFILALLSCIGIGIMGSISIGGNPPLGSLFSPYEGFWQNAVNEEAYSDKIIKLPTLEQPATVIFDERLVPHIFARDAIDAYQLQGYVHAYHRLWQMEMTSRAASGSLAEILGKKLVDYDIHQRSIGMLYAAEQALTSVKKHKKTYAILESYISGINAFIAQLNAPDYPLEYKLMNFAPKKFTPLDVMLIFKQMVYDLAFKNDDIQATLSRQILGDSIFYTLFPDVIIESNPTIPNQAFWNSITPSLQLKNSTIPELHIENKKLVDIMYQMKEHMPHPHNGSNNWAITSDLSQYGAPMLANDPHLSLTLPSIWYETHIITPRFNAYGVSIPGIPGIILGFNNHSAWGSTNVGMDVGDWRKITWEDEELKKYIFNGKSMKPTIRKERILIKNDDPIEIHIPITALGIIPYNTEKKHPMYGFAFHWIAHEVNSDDEFATFLQLNQGRDIIDYENAIEQYNSPAQNLIFADTKGNIGLTVQGQYPIRSVSNSRFIHRADSSSDLWQDYIPNRRIPQEVMYRKGYVSSANQKATTEEYPYPYFGYYEHYRNKTLDSLLEAKTSFSIEDFKQIQLSNYNWEAKHFINAYHQLMPLEKVNKPELKLFYQSLLDWDCNHEYDSEEAVKYAFLLGETKKQLFDEWEFDTLKNILLAPTVFQMIEVMKSKKEFVIWDQFSTPGVTETVDDILPIAISNAYDNYQSWLKNRRNKLGIWADYKNTQIKHLAKIEAFGSQVLNTGGYNSALNAQKPTHGPSWRMIVSLEKPVKAFGVYPGGQQGNPGSKYYDDGIPLWSQGEYHTLTLYKRPEEIENSKFQWEVKP